jgi:predicted thioesterase
VRASARILAVDGRSIRFEVTASDEAGEIGHGSHTRFLVERERFLQKAAGKLDFH